MVKSKAHDNIKHGRSTAVDHHADLQVLKRIRKYFLPKDFTVSPLLLAEISAGYDIGDPVADRLLQTNHKFAKPLQQVILNKKNGKPVDMVNPELLNNKDFQLLINQFSKHPDWFEPELAELGAIAYRRYPLTLIWLLRNVALMAGYSIPALSIPLIQTGTLVNDALARLMRTYSYLLAISEHPELNNMEKTLDIGSEGWRQIIHVRQIHTVVRDNFLQQDWDSDYWGTPVNQTDMVATHMQFSLLIMRGLRFMGARISDEEAKGILHLWNLASWWLGIDLKRLPKNETDCWEWLYTYLATQRLDFEVGKPLADALHALPTEIMGEDNLRGRIVELVNASVTRTFVGDDVGDGLGLPKSKFRYGVLASAPILFGVDTLRKRNDKVAKKLESFRKKRQDNMNWWLKENDNYYRDKA